MDWLQMHMLEHANSITFIAHVIGTFSLVYGLWFHSWLWIIVGIIIAFLGHVEVWLRPNKEKSKVIKKLRAK